MKTLKIVLAVALLFCLLPLPYGGFMLVRFCTMVGFAMIAYHEFQKRKQGWACTFVVLALLFQPFSKLPLGREVWCVVDVIAAGLLLYALADKRGRDV